MKDFIVVINHHDFSVNGTILHDFLSIFTEPERLLLLLPSGIDPSARYAARTLFVCVPTRLSETQLAQFDYERLFVFDYYDENSLKWTEENVRLFGTRARRYLKTSLDRKLDYKTTTGLLPIMLPPALSIEYRKRPALYKRLLNTISSPQKHDLTFLGSTTYARAENRPHYHQRIEWVREIIESGKYNFWGGLIELPYCTQEQLEKKFGDLSRCYYGARQLKYPAFFSKLKASRISLAPTGHARWTYRHLEGIYAGTVVVSTDLSNVDFLLEIPRERIVLVPDHKPVLPYVKKVLSDYKHYEAWIPENIRFMEEQLSDAAYSREKPGVFNKFLAQL
ncbi:MAG: hypothetical protein V1913_03495 [Fibrobacterota bacterium]